jgi:hypothetical protein
MYLTYKNSATILFLVASILLTSCSTMSQSECTMANWSVVGQNDGETGKKSSHYSQYQNDCGEFGISVDIDSYISGWETGIAQYCTRENGYRVGTSGVFYQNSCPAKYEDEFFSAFQMGRTIHREQSQINQIRNQIQRTGDELTKAELTTEQRQSLTDKRQRLKKDLNAVNVRLIIAKVEAQKHGFPAVF